jgi:ATP phosphoribosyltransferase regulatory subunit
LSLPKLNGDKSVLATAQIVFAAADEAVKSALAELLELADLLHAYCPELTVSFDLAELRGYHYHTGVVFSAFVPEMGKEIARGGRYDNIGQIFGRARPATGFSADLKILAALTKVDNAAKDIVRVLAPIAQGDLALDEKVRDLRASGCIVIKALSGQKVNAHDLGCNQTLEKSDENWVLVTLN